MWTLDSYVALKGLRESLHEVLLGEPVPADFELDGVPENMILVVTELATNALSHASPPTVVELRRAGLTFILDVTDHAPHIVPELRQSRVTDVGGRGLQLAQELALDLGWYVRDGVKHVWAEFCLPPR